MNTPEEPLTDLIFQAREMLLDRSKPEADLIYYVAKMDPDLRAAIIIAYGFLYNETENDKS